MLSFVYFICLLVGTPLYAYSPWVPLRVRKHFSLSLIGLSTFFLLFQSAVLVVELVNHSSTDSSPSTRAAPIIAAHSACERGGGGEGAQGIICWESA